MGNNMDNFKVYMHIFPNKKIYIGITMQKPEKRWRNGYGYKENKRMTNVCKGKRKTTNNLHWEYVN